MTNRPADTEAQIAAAGRCHRPAIPTGHALLVVEAAPGVPAGLARVARRRAEADGWPARGRRGERIPMRGACQALQLLALLARKRLRRGGAATWSGCSVSRRPTPADLAVQALLRLGVNAFMVRQPDRLELAGRPRSTSDAWCSRTTPRTSWR